MKLLPLKPMATVGAALLLLSSLSVQQPVAEYKVDLGTLAQIKTEAFQHSQVMENLYYISEVYGPRGSGASAACC